VGIRPWVESLERKDRDHNRLASVDNHRGAPIRVCMVRFDSMGLYQALDVERQARLHRYADGSRLMFSQTIRRKIFGIALGLVILMVTTSGLSMLMARRVAHLLDELTNKYIPAYGHLARVNVHSLERALALRRMVIAKMQTPPDNVGYAERLQLYKDKAHEVDDEAGAARRLIVSII